MIASLSSPSDLNLFPPQMEIEERLAVEEDDGGNGGRFQRVKATLPRTCQGVGA